MPIPQRHRELLESELQDHDALVKKLEQHPGRDRPEMKAQIKLHKTILKVARDANIIKTLDELHDSPELAAQLARNTKAFTEARGIRLPSEATTVVVLSQSPEPVAVGVDFNVSSIHFRLEWNATDGFAVRQLPDPA
jgi:hypothetical protein